MPDPDKAVHSLSQTVGDAGGSNKTPSDPLSLSDGAKDNDLYAWYVVGVLMLAYIFSYVDRTILTLLVGPIRADLNISDTQVSLLHGLAFAIFYTALGLPLGRLADRTNRVRLISIGVIVWSVMTAICGLARNFWQLFLARVGVGVGEAALSPAAYSIITDYFRPEKLSRALSVYVLGSYLGMGVAFMLGGVITAAIASMPPLDLPVLGDVRGWQIAFFLVGIPGILVAWWVATLKEPPRRGKKMTEGAAAVPLKDVWAFLKANAATFSCHLLGFGFLALLVNGAALWTPTFFERTYGWSVPHAGLVYGALIFVFGGFGVYSGGWIADRYDRTGAAGGPFFAAAVGAGLAIVPSTLMPLMSSDWAALVLLAPTIFFGSLPFGLAVSSIQQITPNEMRGQISAIYLFIVNLLGIGLGPTVIALITDYGFGNDMDLRYSMAIVGGIAATIAATCLGFGLKHFRKSLSAASQNRSVSP